MSRTKQYEVEAVKFFSSWCQSSYSFANNFGMFLFWREFSSTLFANWKEMADGEDETETVDGEDET